MLFLFAAGYLGWALGANDTANVFGTGVANELISYRAAIIFTAGFVIFGAIIEGPKIMDTVGQFTPLTLYAAFIAVLSAAIIVTVMTSIKLPVSTSQAILGAIAGIALSIGGWSFTQGKVDQDSSVLALYSPGSNGYISYSFHNSRPPG